MASSSADPLRPDAVVPFHWPQDMESDSDWAGTISNYSAMAAIFLRNQWKAVPWVAGYFGLESFLNARSSQKAGDMLSNQGPILAAVSLGTYYLNIYLLHRRAVQQGMADPLDAQP